MGLRWQWGYIREQLQALEVVISFNTCGQPGCIRQGRLNMELTGRSKIGRPQRKEDVCKNWKRACRAFNRGGC